MTSCEGSITTKVKVIFFVVVLTVFVLMGVKLEMLPVAGKFQNSEILYEYFHQTGVPQPKFQPVKTRLSITKNDRAVNKNMQIAVNESADSVQTQNLKAKKYFIYQCRNGQECGGLADRQKGIVTAYVISQILGAQFGIDMNKPCPLEYYMVPNTVDWIIKKKQLAGLKTQSIGRIGRKKEDEQLAYKAISTLFPADVTYYRGNIDLVPLLMKNPQFEDLDWTIGLSHYDVYRVVYDKLFKLSAHTQQKMDKFRERVGSDKLICSHIRVGGNPAMHDVKRPHTAADPSAVISFLQAKVKNQTSYKIFLATDSPEVNKLFNRTFYPNFVDIEGKVLHIDLYRGSTSGCGGVEKALLDQRILTICDTLVMAHSGFSRIAALYRGSDNNLFIAVKNNVTATKRLDPSFTQRL